MNRHSVKGYFLTAAAILMCFMLVFGKVDARAEAYSYTVTFYPGNHGSFRGTELVEVDNSVSGSAYVVSRDGSAIRVSGLRAGDVVGFDAAMEGAVELEGESRYYVKGIRVSGRDNSTVDASAFRVEEDRDYVVAYGIRGDLTSYVVHYQDTQGNTLAPSRTYYGNVGDKPRMAYLYIEGYQPQAYNLTKTLSKNEAENVFTFVYTRIPTGGGTGTGGAGGGTGGTGTGGAGGTGGGAGGTGTGGTGGAGDGTGGAGAAGGQVPGAEGGAGGTNGTGGGTGGAGAADGQAPGAEGGAATGADDGNVPNPDEGQGAGNGDDSTGQDDDAQTPDDGAGGPADEVNLDDEETPLGGFDGNAESGEGSSGFRFPVWASVCIAVTGAAAVVAALWVMLAARKKAKDGEEHKVE